MMPVVVVLMSTYNGEKYLEEQIQSILKQEQVIVRLFVRDDGSTDNTVNILQKYQNKGKLEFYSGKNLKTARSFIDLIFNAPKAEYYAFSDQDDVWKSNKLIDAVNTIKGSSSRPTLYTGNYQLVNSNLSPINGSVHITTTKFTTSLVASNAIGCSEVFNYALLKILRKAKPGFLIMHDEWVHKVCLAVGGQVFYDKRKTILYRQHMNNVDGGIHTLRSKIKRVFCHKFGKLKFENSKQLISILDIYKDMMPQKNIEVAEYVLSFFDKGLIQRIKLINDKSFNTPTSNLGHEFKLYIILRCW